MTLDAEVRHGLCAVDTHGPGAATAPGYHNGRPYTDSPRRGVGGSSICDIAAILELDGEGVPAPAITQITPPLGDNADVETSISIKEAARHVLACFNAGDIPRAAGLMTEDGVRRAYWGLTIDAENRELARTRIAATPEPRAEEALVRLITVTDVSLLPDRRIAAFVVLNEPLLPPAGPETLLFIFANQDGQWLVDDWIDFSIVPPDFGIEATPAG